MAERWPSKLLEAVNSVKGKRARTVVDHILKNGSITTEEIAQYGYDHPPRAIRDVREQGIPIEKSSIVGTHGRRIAKYTFGDVSKVRAGKLSGRKVWPKGLKDALVARDSARCNICCAEFNPRYLQIDHRVPFEVAGDVLDASNSAEFMLVCGSCNRAKSWSCEHCRNWTVEHKPDVCRTCYWASPERYSHIALSLIRRLDVTWSGAAEVSEYDALLEMSQHARKRLPDFVKDCLRDRLRD